MYLCYPNFILIRTTTIFVILKAIHSIALLDHAVVNDLEWLIEHDITINFPNNIILDEYEAIYLNVYGEAVGVKTCADFLVNFDKDIVCWFLDGSLTVFLWYWINQLKFF